MTNNTVLLHKKLDLIAAKVGAYEIEEIATVVKRQFDRSDGQQATCIDYYGPWNRSGTWPKMKFCHEYIDYDWQISRFERWTGLEFAKLPALDSPQAIRRIHGKNYTHEVPVAKPFRLMVYSPASNDDSESKKLIVSFVPLRYSEDEPDVTPQPQQPAPVPPTEAQVSSASREYYLSLTSPLEQSAYKAYKYDDFVGLMTGVIDRWDEDHTKKAVVSVLGESIMFPGQKTLPHGRQRVALANATKELAGMLDDGVEQVVALQKARAKYEADRHA